jgi:flavin reductase (DIM6/NTAB) family NADH-FMN oxidoreductase RutF
VRLLVELRSNVLDKIKLPNRPLVPFPVVLVGADVNNKPNYATVGACGVVSLEPVLYVSLRRTNYTTSGIKENGFFSVNIPSAEMIRETDYCGIVTGRTTDKSKLFTPFYDELGKAPMISECPLNILCKVIESRPIFDFEFFLGKILAVYLSKQCLTDGKPDLSKINPIILMDINYFSLGQVIGTVYKEGKLKL